MNTSQLYAKKKDINLILVMQPTHMRWFTSNQKKNKIPSSFARFYNTKYHADKWNHLKADMNVVKSWLDYEIVKRVIGWMDIR